MDGRAWQATNHGVAKSRTRLNDFTFTFVINRYNLNIIDTLGWIILCFRVVLYIVSPALQVNSLPPEPWGFSVVLVLKNPPADARDATDTGSLPGLGRSPGGGHGNPLQYSFMDNLMDRRAWQTTVHASGHD